MKIWKAELVLYYNDNGKYETRFYFELQNENYEENKKFNEWTYFVNWVGFKIPMNMQVENSIYSGLKIVQGFNYELDDNELKKVERSMKMFMKKHLKYEKDICLKSYKNKLEAIK